MTHQSLKIGPYETLRMMGSSSFAAAYEARDLRTNDIVVLKVLSKNLPESAVASWLERTQVVDRLRHPSILPILGTGVDGSRWIATPSTSGSLKGRLLLPWDPWDVAPVLEQVGSALDAVHARGIVHGDIKPSNVLFLQGKGPDSSETYLLSDFGMANLAEHGDSMARLGANTPMSAYMSLEQATGLTFTDRSDVFSMGVLAYHLLTTYLPYPGNLPIIVSTKQEKGPPSDPAEENPAVTAAIRDVVLKALATNPDNRYSSGVVFATAFRSALSAVRAPALAPPVLEATPMLGTAFGLCWNCGHRNATNEARCIECGSPLIAHENVVTEDHYLPPPLPPFRRDLIRTAIALVAALMTVLLIGVPLGRFQFPDRPVSSLTAASLPGQWATFQADPLHQGYIPGDLNLQGKVLWSFRMNGPLMAPPVVSADTVYLATGDRRVVAMRKSDGSELWTFPVNGPINSAPALTESSLYVGLRDGTVFALDRSNGQIRWRMDTGGPIYAGITVKNGTAFVANGGGLMALDAMTGKKLWAFAPGDWVTATPSITDDGKVVFGSRDGKLNVLDAQTGERLLAYRSGIDIDSTAALVGDTAVFGLPNGALLGLDVSQHNRWGDHKLFDFKVQMFLWDMWSNLPRQRGFLWVTKPGRATGSSPAVANGVAYYVSFPPTPRTAPGTLLAVNLADQKVLWTAPIDAQRRLGESRPLEPIVVGDTVVVASYDGRMLGFDAKTGAPAWSFATPPSLIPSTSPVVAGDILFAGVSSFQFPRLDIERLDSSGNLLPDQATDAAGNWYYRYPDSPCVKDVRAVYGPYETSKETRQHAENEVPPCGFLYALQ